MTHPDPREDALTKVREALALGRRWTTEHLGNCSEDDTPDEVRKIKEDLADIDDATTALASLSTAPTPYVRPAAEIREQIECCAKFDGPTNKAWVAALTWTLTPPTQEPR